MIEGRNGNRLAGIDIHFKLKLLVGI